MTTARRYCDCAGCGFLIAVLSALTFAVSCGHAAAARAGLLEEIIARSDANYGMIQRGHATYSVTTTLFVNGRAQVPVVDQYELWFDFPQLRIESKREQWRRIYLEDRAISFNAANLSRAKELRPRAFSAIIRPLGYAFPVQIHPRMVGPSKMVSIAHELRELQSSPEWEIDATQGENGDVLVRGRSEAQEARFEYHVALDKGCIVTADTEWALASSADEPYFTMEADCQKADNGAFVLANRITFSKVDVGGTLLPHVREEMHLTSISLTNQPDEKLFTIEGLGLPTGARIQDRIAGNESVFGVAAVTERGVDDVSVTGPSRWRFPLLVGSIAAIAVLVAVIVVGRRRHGAGI